HQRDRYELQKEAIRRNAEQALNEKSEQFEQATVESRENQNKTYAELRERLVKQHQLELAQLENARRAKVQALQNQYDQMRMDKDFEIERLKEQGRRNESHLRQRTEDLLLEKD